MQAGAKGFARLWGNGFRARVLRTCRLPAFSGSSRVARLVGRCGVRPRRAGRARRPCRRQGRRRRLDRPQRHKPDRGLNGTLTGPLFCPRPIIDVGRRVAAQPQHGAAQRPRYTSDVTLKASTHSRDNRHRDLREQPLAAKPCIELPVAVQCVRSVVRDVRSLAAAGPAAQLAGRLEQHDLPVLLGTSDRSDQPADPTTDHCDPASRHHAPPNESPAILTGK